MFGSTPSKLHKSAYICICHLLFVSSVSSNAINTSRNGGKTQRVFIEDKEVCVVDKDVILEAVIKIEHHIVLVEQRSEPLWNLKDKRMIGFPSSHLQGMNHPSS